MKVGRQIVLLVAVIVTVILLAALLFAGLTLFQNPGRQTAVREISFSELLNDIDAGQVHDILIRGREISGTFNDGRKFQTYAPSDPALVQRLYNKGVPITTQP